MYKILDLYLSIIGSVYPEDKLEEFQEEDFTIDKIEIIVHELDETGYLKHDYLKIAYTRLLKLIEEYKVRVD